MADLHAKIDKKNQRLHANTEGKNTEGKNTVSCLECIFFFFFTFFKLCFYFYTSVESVCLYKVLCYMYYVVKVLLFLLSIL